MRSNIGRIIFLSALVSLATLFSCSDSDDGEPAAAQHVKKLTGEWIAETVTFDGVAQDGYDNFTLRITAAGETALYSATGSPPRAPWLLTGTLTPHKNNPEAQLVREDDVPISYTVSSTELTMDFVYIDATAGGRSKSVAGDWRFLFKKK